MRIRRYLNELYDQLKVALSLKTRSPSVWMKYGPFPRNTTLNFAPHITVITVHHWHHRRSTMRPDHRMTRASCPQDKLDLRAFAHEKTLWAGTLIRISSGWLPKRIVFGNLEGAVRRGWVRGRKTGSIACRATSGRLALL